MYICSALLDWYTIELFVGILLRYHLHTQWEDCYLPELSYDKVKWKPTYHVTFVGFDFGTEPVNLYMEVGYGCQDVFAVGIRYAL